MIIKNEYNDIRSQGIVIFHQSPIKRTIFIDFWDDKGAISFFLSFPDILFKIKYYKNNKNNKNINKYTSTQLALTFTNSKKNKIYYPKIPNVSVFEVCNKNFQAKTLEELIEKVIGNFWASEFNFDMGEGSMDFYIKKDFYIKIKKLFKYWKYRTKKDINYIPTKFVERKGVKNAVDWFASC